MKLFVFTICIPASLTAVNRMQLWEWDGRRRVRYQPIRLLYDPPSIYYCLGVYEGELWPTIINVEDTNTASLKSDDQNGAVFLPVE